MPTQISTGIASHLKEHFFSCSPSSFPGGMDYVARYRGMEAFLNENVHPVVTTGASFVNAGFLTDHGPKHIQTVIDRASDLLEHGSTSKISCYELYLLLAAIHVHDVGNIYGREGHELGSAEIIEKLGPLFGPDDVEKRAIFKIAQAHGGKNGPDKDKIKTLSEVEYLLGHKVRPQFLAALVRLADELADDRSRTRQSVVPLPPIPKQSEIFHKYAYALHTVAVIGNAARLEFELTKQDAVSLYGKLHSEIYLLDEIYERMIKMHYERLYCMRFLRPTIAIDKIDVSIRVFGPGFADDPLATIDFRLEEAGYPTGPAGGIVSLCPQLQNHRCGSPLTGASLKSFLEGTDVD